MGKIWKIIACGFAVLMLQGCGSKEQGDQIPVVTQVQIVHMQEGMSVAHCYTGQQKITSILNYFRTLEDQGRTNLDPERILGDAYRVRICLSDGKEHVYWQRADRYLSRDRHTWHLVDRDQARQLPILVRQMVSDI